MNTYGKRWVVMSAFGLSLVLANGARAHCEIPCGIYGDRMRMDLLREHCETVEKSMQEINKLGAADQKNYNQLVRWITNKELHADKIQEIVTQYFMTQRVTPVDAKQGEARDRYTQQITLLHRMLVQAMKCKQTTDEDHVAALRSLLDEFQGVYFESAEHSHD